MLEEEHEILHLRARFEPDTPDPVWLRDLGHEGEWVVLSGDVKITRNRDNRKAWLESGLTAFFFGERYPQKRHWQQVGILLKFWPRIKTEAQEHRDGPAGTGYIIQPSSNKWRTIRPTDK